MMLQKEGVQINCLRLRALPFTAEFEAFLDSHERIYVVEQNRDAQLMSIIRAELPQYHAKCFSVLHYDGLPMDAETVFAKIHAQEAKTK
ncbi:MAG: hypothetical protein ACXVA9_00425 [Bdellovibrionales bacterium]